MTVQTMPSTLAARLSALEETAKARGFTPRASGPIRQPRQPASRRETTAGPARPASPWDKWLCKSCPQGKTTYAMRIIGRMICRCLGPDWKLYEKDADGHYVNYLILLHSSGAEISFRRDWKDNNRFQFHATKEADRDALPTISASAERTPAAIASDVQRKIIDAGLYDQYKRSQDGERKRLDRKTRDKLAMIRTARAFGVGLSRYSHYSDFATETRQWFGSNNHDFDGIETEVSAKMEYSDRIALEIETRDIILIEAIAAVIEQHQQQKLQETN